MADTDNLTPITPADNSPAPSPAPEPAPAAPVEPSRREVIERAVAAQKAPKADDAPSDDKPKQPRAPDGKFAPIADGPGIDKPVPAKAEAVTPPKPAEAAPEAPKPEEAQTQPDPNAPVLRPPPGWSPASKVAFDTLPESVKADIAKREVEVNKGFEKLAQYKPVEKYFEMARQGGTTLDRALEQYVGIENLLRRDVFAGVEQVLKNVGVNPVAFAQAYLNRQGGGHQNAPQADPARQQAIDPQELVRQTREEVRAELEAQRMQDEINRFSSDPKNRFYENVKGDMALLLKEGRAESLQDAYDKACRLDPEIWKLVNQPVNAPVDLNAVKVAQAANQARAAAKATTGAPTPGMSPGSRPLDPNLSLRDTIKAAADAQRARI